MSSLSSSLQRQIPQQERALRRISQFLDAASEIFAKLGYEAATMTAVAEKCNSSIGALYRYFPDKTALAQALVNRYGLELEEEWKNLVEETREKPIEEFAEQLVDWIATFITDHPSYLPLLAAPIKFRRDAAARHKLRFQLWQAFSERKSDLTEEDGILIANVVVEIIKGCMAVYGDASPKDRKEVLAQFKKVLANYLGDVLR
jgi:AcrR family transcriptional regulator